MRNPVPILCATAQQRAGEQCDVRHVQATHLGGAWVCSAVRKALPAPFVCDHPLLSPLSVSCRLDPDPEWGSAASLRQRCRRGFIRCVPAPFSVGMPTRGGPS